MLTKNQNRALSFFLSRAMLLGGGISNIFALSGKDAYLSAILGLLLGLGIIFLINFFSRDIKTNLKDYLKTKSVLNCLLKGLFFLFYSLIIFIGILFFSTLVSSYYLTYTPSFMICLPILFLLIYLTNKGLKVLGRVAQIIFPVCLIIIIIKILLLMDAANWEYFLPFLTYQPSKIFLAALFFAVLTASPALMLIEEKVPLKQQIINYLIGGITGFFIITNITSVLGDTLVKIFSYPEYAILRKIEFFNFIENVENLIAYIWLCDLFLTVALAVNRLTNLSSKSPKLTYLYLTILILFITLFVEKNYAFVMICYQSFIYLFLIILSFILLGLAIKHLKQK